MFKNSDGIVTGQYIIVKYRMPTTNKNNDDMVFQFFTSTEHGVDKISDPLDSFVISTANGQLVADGEWHVVVIDTSSYRKSTIKANSAGEYKIQYVRFDPFNGLKSPKGDFVDQVDIGYFALHGNLDEIIAYCAEDGVAQVTLVTNGKATHMNTAE